MSTGNPVQLTVYTNFQPIISLLVCKIKKHAIIDYNNLLVVKEKLIFGRIANPCKKCLLYLYGRGVYILNN